MLLLCRMVRWSARYIAINSFYCHLFQNISRPQIDDIATLLTYACMQITLTLHPVGPTWGSWSSPTYARKRSCSLVTQNLLLLTFTVISLIIQTQLNNVIFWRSNCMEYIRGGGVRIISGFVRNLEYCSSNKHTIGLLKASRHSLTPFQLHRDCRRTYGNPFSTSAETIESYCTFGDPCSSPAETVKCQYTFGNAHSNSVETVKGWYSEPLSMPISVSRNLKLNGIFI